MQDGDAPWARLLPRVSGVYETRFTADRGGVAYVPNGGTSLTVVYGSLTELEAISCSTGSSTLSGTVAGLASEERADVWLGLASVSVNAQNTRFQLRNVAAGAQDLFATRYTWSGTGDQLANRLVIRRGQNFTSSSRIPTIDFGSSESFATTFATASVAGADDATAISLSSSWNGPASSALLMNSTAPGPQVYAAVPQDQLQPGELSSLQAFAVAPSGGRSATTYFRAPTDRVITLGPALSTPVVTWPGAVPRPRPSLQLSSQPEYARTAWVTWRQGVAAVSVTTTSTYLGGTPAIWNLEVPDLSSVDGWNDAWGLAPASGINWLVSAEGGPDRSLGDAVGDGDLFRSADNSGSTEAAIGRSVTP